MSRYLGECHLALSGEDLNRWCDARGLPVHFQQGCFTLHLKLPIGLGVTLVAIPRASADALIFSIPFEQIRGDRTGGMAKWIAGGLWSVIRPQIESEVRRRLVSQGLPSQVISLDQASEAEVKVGRVILHLKPLNAWLWCQPPISGLRWALKALWVDQEAIQVLGEVFEIQALGGQQACRN